MTPGMTRNACKALDEMRLMLSNVGTAFAALNSLLHGTGMHGVESCSWMLFVDLAPDEPACLYVFCNICQALRKAFRSSFHCFA